MQLRKQLTKTTYWILALSAMAFSAFACHFTLKEVLHIYVAIGLASVLAFATHLFSHSIVKGVSDYKEGSFNFSADIIVFLLLVSVSIFLDFRGVNNYSEKENIAPVELTQNELITAKLKAIASQEEIRDNNANHTTNGRTNWAMYGTFIKTQKELTVLRKELSILKKDKTEAIQKATDKAKKQSSKMSGGVVVSVLLMLLSTWGLMDNKQSIDNNITAKDDNDFTTNIKDFDNNFTSLSKEQRKALASIDIKNNKSYQMSVISKKYGLNFSEVKSVKESLESTKEVGVIGF